MNVLSKPKSPLEIPEILSIIIGHCDVETVKSVRLVSRKWSELSLPRWRSIAPVRLEHRSSDHALQKFNRFIKTKKSRFQEHPYRKYYLRNRVSPVFFRQCVQFVKELHLDGTLFSSDNDCHKVVFESPVLEKLILWNVGLPVTKDLLVPENSLNSEPQHASPTYKVNPNLKIIKINGAPDYGIGLCRGVTWMDLLVHFPNLKEIDLEDLDDVQVQGLFLALIRLGNAAPDLKTLMIPRIPGYERRQYHLPQVSDHSGAYLAQPGTNLSKFGINWGDEDNWNEYLGIVMSAHGHKLKALHLEGFCGGPFSLGDLSGFSSLEELVISGEPLPSLAFLKWLPQLRTLKLRSFRVISRTSSEEIQTIKMENLENLEITNYYDREDVQNLDAVFSIFPNVKKLTVDNWCCGFFRKVCQRWKGLEQMTSLKNSDLSNCEVTGLTEVEMSSIANLSYDEMKAKAKTFKTDEPNITWLTGLRFFIQEGETRFIYNGILDNSSALFGFLKLPNLYHLRLPRVKMFPEVVADLKASFVCVEIGSEP